MKKLLLIALALGVGFASFAQNQKRNFSAMVKGTPVMSPFMKQRAIIDPVTTASGGLKGPVKPSKHVTTVKGPKGSLNLNKVEFSSSGNMLTVEFNSIRTLSAIPSLNLVAFTHRAGGDYGATANYLKVSYTTDNGTTFDSLILATSNVAPNYPRYPSGVLLNPASNTNAKHAILGFAGPYTNATNWMGNYLCSERLDSGSVHKGFLSFPLPTSNYQGVIEFKGLASCNTDQNPMVHGFIPYDGLSGGTTGYWNQPPFAKIFNAKYVAGDSLAWFSDTASFPAPHFVAYPSNAPAVNFWGQGQAWNEDGTVGYVYFFGADSLAVNNGVVPIVYKSTDHGTTWVKQPLFDFGTISTIHDSLFPTLSNLSLQIPNFSESEVSGAVDNNGNLHLLSVIRGMLSINPDSLGYYYANEAGHLYDLYTKTGGGWDARYISSILSENVDYQNAAALTYSGGNSIGWEHRPFLTRTADGKKMFAVWNDVQDSTISKYITVPDIFGFAWDNVTGYKTPVKNFTKATAYDGENYWMEVADRVLVSGNNYNIPITTTITNADGTATSACDHYYLSGVYFSENDFCTSAPTAVITVSGNTLTNPFTGSTIENQWYRNDTLIVGATNNTYVMPGAGNYFDVITNGCGSETSNVISFSGIKEYSNISSVSAYPNPFKGTTTIEVSLDKASDISLSVSNMVGQKVYESDKGSVSAGTHTYTFDGSKLQSGIYFYTIKSGNNTVTNKMIIE
jgi:hypothetical protein